MTNYREYIYAVYQEKSFSKAAKKLYVSQPWLSATIKKAEQELGLALFDRSTNPISPTEAGRYYIEKLEEIAAIEAEMSEHFKQMRDVGRTELHIGSSMFFCTYVLPALMEDFRLQYPQVTLTFTEGGNKTLLEKLLNGRLDFLLEAERPANSRIHSIPWASEEIVLAVPARNPVNKELDPYRYSFGAFLDRPPPSASPPGGICAGRLSPFERRKRYSSAQPSAVQKCRVYSSCITVSGSNDDSLLSGAGRAGDHISPLHHSGACNPNRQGGFLSAERFFGRAKHLSFLHPTRCKSSETALN